MTATALSDAAPGTADHDYRRTPGDWFLDAVKFLVPNAEARHHLLATYARIRSWVPPHPGVSPALEKTLRFHDRSLPLIIGNPVFLAAGGNKSAENLPAFADLGFGGITVGSATQTPWAGNPQRPRVRLLPRDRAMQNSMGLNNPGIERIAAEVDRSLGLCHRRRMALGISVADTPGTESEDKVIAEVEAVFRRAYGAADYVELNLSCPNTGNARLDTDVGLLGRILSHVMEIRRNLVPRKAVLVKLSPDLGSKTLEAVLQTVSDAGVSGLVLFNTFPGSRSRFLNMATPAEEIKPLTGQGGLGGISGRILYQNTVPAIRFIRKQVPQMTLFACGGIDHGAKALDLLEAGADAVQVYTVLAYRWNAVRKMNRELLLAMKSRGIPSLDGYAPWASA
jgi:dihydroorotate dehydrogenase